MTWVVFYRVHTTPHKWYTYTPRALAQKAVTEYHSRVTRMAILKK